MENDQNLEKLEKSIIDRLDRIDIDKKWIFVLGPYEIFALHGILVMSMRHPMLDDVNKQVYYNMEDIRQKALNLLALLGFSEFDLMLRDSGLDIESRFTQEKGVSILNRWDRLELGLFFDMNVTEILAIHGAIMIGLQHPFLKTKIFKKNSLYQSLLDKLNLMLLKIGFTQIEVAHLNTYEGEEF